MTCAVLCMNWPLEKTLNTKSVSDRVETLGTAQKATCCNPSLHRDLLWTDTIKMAQINIFSPASAFQIYMQIL